MAGRNPYETIRKMLDSATKTGAMVVILPEAGYTPSGVAGEPPPDSARAMGLGERAITRSEFQAYLTNQDARGINANNR